MNPFVKPTLRRRFHAWLCRKFGHLRFGSYYGMPQAHCRRCGAKLYGAIEGASDWVEPWGEYE